MLSIRLVIKLSLCYFSLQKGAGYHLDLLLVAIIIGICSLLGLPWVVAATVLSVGHVQSLFVESQCTAPGEKAQFLGVRYCWLVIMQIHYTLEHTLEQMKLLERGAFICKVPDRCCSE